MILNWQLREKRTVKCDQAVFYIEMSMIDWVEALCHTTTFPRGQDVAPLNDSHRMKIPLMITFKRNVIINHEWIEFLIIGNPACSIFAEKIDSYKA
uniref:Uncharacterized protein n=1 Tax=Onchocerca volvulus TaxID=6282 RepID=A0A8R1XNW0_ONCVO